MQWLSGLAAFAATMLIFALIVSTFVELIHRVFRLRARGLHMMLETYFTDILANKLKLASNSDQDGASNDPGVSYTSKTTGSGSTNVAGNKSNAIANASGFADEIMANPVIPGSSSNNHGGVVSRVLHRFLDASVVTQVPVEVFTERLVESRFINNIDKVSDDALLDIAQKYELYGSRASEYFERRARLFSVLIAMVIAMFFYVNPYQLMVQYVQNPANVEAVIAQATRNYTASPIAISIENPDQADTLKVLLKELDNRVDEVSANVHELNTAGIAVGWPSMDSLTECPKNRDFAASICKVKVPLFSFVPYPGWADILWLIVGGLLICLGAPFWARVLSHLSAAQDITRSLASVVGQGGSSAQDTGSTGMIPERSGLESTHSNRRANGNQRTPLSLATFRAAKAGRAAREN